MCFIVLFSNSFKLCHKAFTSDLKVLKINGYCFYADKLKVRKRIFLHRRIKSAYVAMLQQETLMLLARKQHMQWI